MEFRVAKTFYTSLEKLDKRDQSIVKESYFDLLRDPTTPGLQLHRVDLTIFIRNKH